MQTLKSKGVTYGFRTVELHQIVSEVTHLGEHWESPGSREEGHQHRYWELGYAAKGTSDLYVGEGRRFHLNAGSFWCVAAGTDHWLWQGPEAAHHRLFVGLQLPTIVSRHSDWNLSKLLREVVVLHEVYQFEKLFARIITEGVSTSHYQAAGLLLGVDALLLEIVRVGTDGNRRGANAIMHPAVSRALNLLQTRFRESWSLERLASESGMSRARLAELFRRQVGTSIHKVLNKIRVENGQMLLKDSELSIGQIATDCGFATSQHFARIFRQLTGATAAEYRELYRGR
ncbi:MAG: helix-turn-helix domain-containing protein [Verrucomicrobia bacterium]|nr:helix-turn-helix domain-containing protein [Verrucomicrobiota bacterium]MBV8484705.1 helix-turn-helix domain-containing protein [Verrucomicrobiota bacterium]